MPWPHGSWGGQTVEGVSAFGADQSQRQCEDCETEDAQRASNLQRMEGARQEEGTFQTKGLEGDVQRQSEPEEEVPVHAKARREGVQRQDEDEGEEIQAKAKADGSFTTSAALTAQVGGLKGGGQPLSASTRASFEPRFGADFSDVRVHTGKPAQEAAKALHARAFTTGRDVVFGSGEYAPNSRAGGGHCWPMI